MLNCILLLIFHTSCRSFLGVLQGISQVIFNMIIHFLINCLETLLDEYAQPVISHRNTLELDPGECMYSLGRCPVRALLSNA